MIFPTECLVMWTTAAATDDDDEDIMSPLLASKTLHDIVVM